MSCTYKELVTVQFEEFPDSIIVSKMNLLDYHRGEDDRTQYNIIKNSNDDLVFYYLPPGTYGAADDVCCNGIRYGMQGGEYISLSHISPPDFVADQHEMETFGEIDTGGSPLVYGGAVCGSAVWPVEKDKYDLGQHSPGAKLDDGKVDMSLLEYLPRAMYEICRVMTMGKTKYTRGGFLEVPDALNRYRAARGRHEVKFDMGQEFDDDPFYDTQSGRQFKGKIMHKAQVAVNAIFELEVYLRGKEEESNEDP